MAVLCEMLVGDSFKIRFGVVRDIFQIWNAFKREAEYSGGLKTGKKCPRFGFRKKSLPYTTVYWLHGVGISGYHSQAIARSGNDNGNGVKIGVVRPSWNQVFQINFFNLHFHRCREQPFPNRLLEKPSAKFRFHLGKIASGHGVVLRLPFKLLKPIIKVVGKFSRFHLTNIFWCFHNAFLFLPPFSTLPCLVSTKIYS